VKDFVHVFLDAGREEMVKPSSFPNIGAKSITTAVHILFRYHLLDLLMDALGLPRNEERIMFPQTPLLEVPGKLSDVSESTGFPFVLLIYLLCRFSRRP
jgi:hypothetical protein